MARVRIKPGVQPKLVELVAIVCEVAQSLSVPDEVWITSGMDSIHSPNSLHYALRAVDLRTKNFPTLASKQEFAQKLRAALGPDYDVILESLGLPNEHIHVEHDPK